MGSGRRKIPSRGLQSAVEGSEEKLLSAIQAIFVTPIINVAVEIQFGLTIQYFFIILIYWVNKYKNGNFEGLNDLGELNLEKDKSDNSDSDNSDSDINLDEYEVYFKTINFFVNIAYVPNSLETYSEAYSITLPITWKEFLVFITIGKMTGQLDPGTLLEEEEETGF